jgi:hypothetical protein
MDGRFGFLPSQDQIKGSNHDSSAALNVIDLNHASHLDSVFCAMHRLP